MNLINLVLSLILVQCSACHEIIGINLPLSHLSQYFNSLPKFVKKLNETSEGVYKEFLNSKEFDRDSCWGYEYDCKKPAMMHRCPGNFTGYVKSKEVQLDVFYAQADFGRKKYVNEFDLIYCFINFRIHKAACKRNDANMRANICS